MIQAAERPRPLPPCGRRCATKGIVVGQREMGGAAAEIPRRLPVPTTWRKARSRPFARRYRRSRPRSSSMRTWRKAANCACRVNCKGSPSNRPCFPPVPTRAPFDGVSRQPGQARQLDRQFLGGADEVPVVPRRKNAIWVSGRLKPPGSVGRGLARPFPERFPPRRRPGKPECQIIGENKVVQRRQICRICSEHSAFERFWPMSFVSTWPMDRSGRARHPRRSGYAPWFEDEPEQECRRRRLGGVVRSRFPNPAEGLDSAKSGTVGMFRRLPELSILLSWR